MSTEWLATALDKEHTGTFLSGDDYAIRRYGRSWVFVCVWHEM